MEQLANNPVTTLNGAITNVATTLVVTDASNFPTSGNFTIKIDSELLRVTAVSTNTFTVTRAQEGTTAATHADASDVKQVVTSNVMTRLITEMYQTGTSASRPSAVRAGTEYHATDADLGWRYNGTNWDLIRPLYVPYANRVNVSGWTDLNNTGLTWTDYNGVYLNSLAGSSGGLRAKYHTLPTAPFSATAIIGFPPMAQAGSASGIILYDSGTTKVKNYMITSLDNGYRMTLQNWTSPTAFSAELTNNTKVLIPNRFMYIKFTDDNTNWKYEISQDNVDWVTIYSETRNTFLTPTHIGLAFYKDTTYFSTNTTPYDVYAYWEA